MLIRKIFSITEIWYQALTVFEGFQRSSKIDLRVIAVWGISFHSVIPKRMHWSSSRSTWESTIIANMKMFLVFALCIGFAASFDLEQIQFSNEGTLEQSSINSGQSIVIFRPTLFFTSFPSAWLLNQNIISTLSCGSSVDGKLFSLLLVSMPLGTYRLLWAPEISFFVFLFFCFAWYLT